MTEGITAETKGAVQREESVSVSYERAAFAVDSVIRLCDAWNQLGGRAAPLVGAITVPAPRGGRGIALMGLALARTR